MVGGLNLLLGDLIGLFVYLNVLEYNCNFIVVICSIIPLPILLYDYVAEFNV